MLGQGSGLTASTMPMGTGPPSASAVRWAATPLSNWSRQFQADRSRPLTKAETLLEVTMNPHQHLQLLGQAHPPPRHHAEPDRHVAGGRLPGVPAPDPLAAPRGDHTLSQPHPDALDRPGGEARQNIIQDHTIRLDPDGFVATARGRLGGTWAHWQLALAYARYLSPASHLWCNTVVRAALVWHDGRSTADHDPLRQHLARQFRALHDRLDTLERHQADLMFLQLSA